MVLECTGRGNANERSSPAVREAVEAGVRRGRLLALRGGERRPVYGAGGGRDLAEAGALFAGDLAGPKARVLLQLALGAGHSAAAALQADSA